MLAGREDEEDIEKCWICHDCYIKAKGIATNMFGSNPQGDKSSIVRVSYRMRTCCFCAQITERSCGLNWKGTRMPLPKYMDSTVVPEHLEFHYPTMRLNNLVEPDPPEIEALHELLDTMKHHGYAVSQTLYT